MQYRNPLESPPLLNATPISFKNPSSSFTEVSTSPIVAPVIDPDAAVDIPNPFDTPIVSPGSSGSFDLSAIQALINTSLTDYALTSYVDAQILVVTAAIAAAIDALDLDYSLDELTDVTITTPTTGQYLRYNGSAWVNATIDYSDIVGTPGSGDFVDLTSAQSIGGSKTFTSMPTVNVASGIGLTLINTNDSTNASILAIKHLSPTPANGDVLSNVRAYGYNSINEDTLFGRFQVVATDITDGAEYATTAIGGLQNGVMTDLLTLGSTAVFSVQPYHGADVMWTAGNDGSGSGLDADLWDGNQFATYLNQSLLTTSSPTFGNLYVTSSVNIQSFTTSSDIDALLPGTTSGALIAGPINGHVVLGIRGNDSNDGFYIVDTNNGGSGAYSQLLLAVSAAQFAYKSNTIWHAGNDGAGSGLDADLLDGYNIGTSGSAIPLLSGTNTWGGVQTFPTGTSISNSGGAALLHLNGAAATWRYINGRTSGSNRWALILGNSVAESGSNAGSNFQLQSYDDSATSLRTDLTITRSTGAWAIGGSSVTIGGNTVWHSGNDGSGSTLDADLLDGYQASAFALLASNPTFTTANALVTAQGSAGYGAFYALGSGTNNAYMFFGNVSNGERYRITSDTSRNLYFSATDGATSQLVITPTGYLAQLSTQTAATYQHMMTFSPSDYGVGKPSLYITNASAASWVFGLYDGVNSNGTISIGAQYFLHNGSTVWTSGNDGSGSGLDADLLDGYDSLALAFAGRAQRSLIGGGTITVDGSGYVGWTTRFIVISSGRGSTTAPSGYFNIEQPTSGTITGVGGSSDVTATAAGIPVSAWKALYYVLPLGSGVGSNAANFRLVSYTADVDIPEHWVLICSNNGDSGVYTFNNGIQLVAGQSFTGTSIPWNSGNDGSGSGLDADLLDGYNIGSSGGAIPLLNGTNTWSGVTTYTNKVEIRRNGATAPHSLGDDFVIGVENNHAGMTIFSSNAHIGYIFFGDPDSSVAGRITYNHATDTMALGTGADSSVLAFTTSTITYQGSTVWHAGNDGAASGLDADLWDGNQFATYLNQALLTTSNASFNNVTVGSSAAVGQVRMVNGTSSPDRPGYIGFYNTAGTRQGYIGYLTGTAMQMQVEGSATEWRFNATPSVSGSAIWHAGNDGAGSGLDADLWDGNQFATYLNQALLTTSNPTFNGLTVTALVATRPDMGSAIFTGTAQLGVGNRSITLATPTSNSASEPFIWNTGNSIRWDIDGVARILLDSAGNLTLTPPSILTISGGARQEIRVSGSTAANAWGRNIVIGDETAAGNAGLSILTANDGNAWIFFGDSDLSTVARIRYEHNSNTMTFGVNGDSSVLAFTSSDITYQGNAVWHAGNDGAGSGLDADLLDGYNIGTSGSAIPLLSGANIWSTNNKFAGGLEIYNTTSNTNLIMGNVGTDAYNTYIYMRSPAGYNSLVALQTGTLNRWLIYKNSTAESGSNAGSNFIIQAYDDAGSSLGTGMAITRSTLAVAFGGTSMTLGGIAVPTISSTSTFTNKTYSNPTFSGNASGTLVWLNSQNFRSVGGNFGGYWTNDTSADQMGWYYSGGTGGTWNFLPRPNGSNDTAREFGFNFTSLKWFFDEAPLVAGSAVWHPGNDGSGSGLDADLWDGNQFATYLNQALLTSSSVVFANITARATHSTGVSGVLTASHANVSIELNGNVTLNNSVFTAGDKTTFDPGTAARTFTRGAGVTMYVNGTNSATATLSANQMGGMHWRSSSVVVLTGAFA